MDLEEDQNKRKEMHIIIVNNDINTSIKEEFDSREQVTCMYCSAYAPVIFLSALDMRRAWSPICWSVMSPSNSALGTSATIN